MKFRLSEQQLTEQDLRHFENKYKLKLPKIYRELILENNGGYPEKDYFEGRKVYFLPIKYGGFTIEDSLNLSDSNYLPKGFFPFSDGGIKFCISLNKDNYEKIFFLDETGEYELVADSFEDFMNELSDNPDY